MRNISAVYNTYSLLREDGLGRIEAAREVYRMLRDLLTLWLALEHFKNHK